MSGKHSLCVRASIIFVAIPAISNDVLRAAVTRLRKFARVQRGRERNKREIRPFFFSSNETEIVGRRSVNRASRSSWRKQKRRGLTPAEGPTLQKNNSAAIKRSARPVFANTTANVAHDRRSEEGMTRGRLLDDLRFAAELFAYSSTHFITADNDAFWRKMYWTAQLLKHNNLLFQCIFSDI